MFVCIYIYSLASLVTSGVLEIKHIKYLYWLGGLLTAKLGCMLEICAMSRELSKKLREEIIDSLTNRKKDTKR